MGVLLSTLFASAKGTKRSIDDVDDAEDKPTAKRTRTISLADINLDGPVKLAFTSSVPGYFVATRLPSPQPAPGPTTMIATPQVRLGRTSVNADISTPPATPTTATRASTLGRSSTRSDLASAPTPISNASTSTTHQSASSSGPSRLGRSLTRTSTLTDISFASTSTAQPAAANPAPATTTPTSTASTGTVRRRGAPLRRSADSIKYYDHIISREHQVYGAIDGPYPAPPPRASSSSARTVATPPPTTTPTPTNNATPASTTTTGTTSTPAPRRGAPLRRSADSIKYHDHIISREYQVYGASDATSIPQPQSQSSWPSSSSRSARTADADAHAHTNRQKRTRKRPRRRIRVHIVGGADNPYAADFGDLVDEDEDEDEYEMDSGDLEAETDVEELPELIEQEDGCVTVAKAKSMGLKVRDLVYEDPISVSSGSGSLEAPSVWAPHAALAEYDMRVASRLAAKKTLEDAAAKARTQATASTSATTPFPRQPPIMGLSLSRLLQIGWVTLLEVHEFCGEEDWEEVRRWRRECFRRVCKDVVRRRLGAVLGGEEGMVELEVEFVGQVGDSLLGLAASKDESMKVQVRVKVKLPNDGDDDDDADKADAAADAQDDEEVVELEIDFSEPSSCSDGDEDVGAIPLSWSDGEFPWLLDWQGLSAKPEPRTEAGACLGHVFNRPSLVSSSAAANETKRDKGKGKEKMRDVDEGATDTGPDTGTNAEKEKERAALEVLKRLKPSDADRVVVIPGARMGMMFFDEGWKHRGRSVRN